MLAISLGDELWLNGLSKFAASLGSDEFGRQLFSLLELLKIDHCAVFTYADKGGAGHLFTLSCMSADKAKLLSEDYAAGYYQQDPQLAKLCQWSGAVEAQQADLPASNSDYDGDYASHFFRETGLVDKLFTVTQVNGTQIYCNFYRMEKTGPFSEQDKAQLKLVLPTITHLIQQHIRLQPALLGRCKPAGASVAREMIHSVLSSNAPPFDVLTSRERHISERILIGMTSTGIALDLDIAESSVNTYRRRAYEKLGICSQNELFSLCLEAIGRTTGG